MAEKDPFLVDEPLYSVAEGYIDSAIEEIEGTKELLYDVATHYPNGFRLTDYILYSCSVISDSFNYIMNFRKEMALARENLATLDEGFAEAQKKNNKGLLSSFFDETGAALKKGFSSLFNGEGIDSLLDAFASSGATLLVLANSTLNKAANTVIQPFMIMLGGDITLLAALFSKENVPLSLNTIKRLARGEVRMNPFDSLYNTKFGQKVNDKSFIKFDSPNVRQYEKTKLTKFNESLLEMKYNINHNKSTKALDTSAREMKSFNVIFNEHYGGAQGDPIDILNKYGSERRMLNDTSINGQKAQIIYSKIKEYYPDATLDDIKKIAEAYNNSGCSYMAVADAFTLHVSSQENGEKIFKKVVGKPLYSTDGTTKSANVEAMALDLFLYKNRQKSMDDIINNENGSNSSNTVYMENAYLKNYFKDKKVNISNTHTDVNVDKDTRIKMAADISSFEEKHDDAVYILAANNFNMVSRETTGDNSGDSALANANTTGEERNYIKNVGSHAMFITGYNDDSIEVSSWAGKYDIPVSSTYANSYNEEGYPDIYIVGYDFDYSNVFD